MDGKITVQKIISILLRRIKFIIIVTLAATVMFFLYSKFFITPTYTTSSMIFVQNYKNSSKTGSNADSQKMFSSDISASSTLAGICVTIFQNSDEMTALYNGCNVSITAGSGNFFITFTVSGDDAQKCADVANQLAEKSKDVFDNFFAYGQTGKLREAKVPTSSTYPNNMKNAMYGFAIGLVAAVVISILLELIDATIKPDDDLQQMYNLPVFAEIPDFENQG